MFAAKAGAAKVIGVDCSDILSQAQQIVARNRLDGVVTLVKGKMEEVDLGLSPGQKVDVIISEWMGYCLLYESMLPSVLAARDQYLASGGRLLPNRCTMIIQGARDLDGRLDWWENVYGLDMTPLKGPVIEEPSVEAVDPQAIMTDDFVFKNLDLMTIKTADLDFDADFKVVVTKPAPLRGLVVSFDTFFEGTEKSDPVVEFSTRPEAKDTHWHQTLFWLQDAPAPELEVGTVVQGKIKFVRNVQNPRDYDVEIVWEVLEGSNKVLGQGQQRYTLGS